MEAEDRTGMEGDGKQTLGTQRGRRERESWVQRKARKDREVNTVKMRVK